MAYNELYVCEHVDNYQWNMVYQLLDMWKVLRFGAAVTRAIQKAGGEQVEKDSSRYVQDHDHVKIGSAHCMTSADNMPYKKVIHTVGPQCHRIR